MFYLKLYKVKLYDLSWNCIATKSNIIGATISPRMAPKMRGEIENHPHSRGWFGEIHQFFHAIFRQNTLRSCFDDGTAIKAHFTIPKKHLPSFRNGLTGLIGGTTKTDTLSTSPKFFVVG